MLPSAGLQLNASKLESLLTLNGSYQSIYMCGTYVDEHTRLNIHRLTGWLIMQYLDMMSLLQMILWNPWIVSAKSGVVVTIHWNLPCVCWFACHLAQPRARNCTAIINLERGIPSKPESSAWADYVPALCTHRPSLLPIEWSGELFGLQLGSVCGLCLGNVMNLIT